MSTCPSSNDHKSGRLDNIRIFVWVYGIRIRARAARVTFGCADPRAGVWCVSAMRVRVAPWCVERRSRWITTAAFSSATTGGIKGRSSGELCVVGVVGVVVVDAREVDVVGARETERAQVSRETVGFKRPVDGVARGGA